jgi:hypothetical protein
MLPDLGIVLVLCCQIAWLARPAIIAAGWAYGAVSKRAYLLGGSFSSLAHELFTSDYHHESNGRGCERMRSLFRIGLDGWATFEFVAFWKRFYDSKTYPEHVYEHNLNRNGKLTETNVRELISWKYGYANADHASIREIQLAKWDSLGLIHECHERLNLLRNSQQLDEDVLKQSVRANLELVRKVNNKLTMAVFLAHIARPDDVPIFDVYVEKAWRYISQFKQVFEDAEYYLAYRRFFRDFCGRCASPAREVDKALWALGNFLLSECQLC